jgi:Na+-transporting methylmalonyl-CoA/oxaloacetate decarboxylase gamma subunit
MKFVFSFLAILLALGFYFGVVVEEQSDRTVKKDPKEVVDKISSTKKSEVYDQWLKDQFEANHQKLMPVVAVADMFFSCNKKRQPSAEQYSLKQLITEMDKNTLATNLDTCLGDDGIKSEQALNFGLLGCFSEQLSILPEAQRVEKMLVVENSFSSLSREDRQKSFTRCISEQAINYL